MKNKDNVRLSTLRLIKTKFLEYKTSKGAKPIDNNMEISLLKKMTSLPIEGYLWYFYENKVHKVDPNNK